VERAVQGAADRRHDFGGVRRLRQQGGEFAGHLWRQWRRRERTGNHDDRNPAPGRAERERHAHSVEDRHGSIRDHEIEFFLRELLQTSGAIAGGFDLVAVALEDARVQFANGCVVVHDEQPWPRCAIGEREKGQLIDGGGVVVHGFLVLLSAPTLHPRRRAG